MAQTTIEIRTLNEGFVTSLDGRTKAHTNWDSVVDYVNARFYSQHYAGTSQRSDDVVRITATSEYNPKSVKS